LLFFDILWGICYYFSKENSIAEAETAGKLRQLYLPARYEDTAEITPQHVREARKLLHQLEKDSKSRKK